MPWEASRASLRIPGVTRRLLYTLALTLTLTLFCVRVRVTAVSPSVVN